MTFSGPQLKLKNAFAQLGDNCAVCFVGHLIVHVPDAINQNPQYFLDVGSWMASNVPRIPRAFTLHEGEELSRLIVVKDIKVRKFVNVAWI